MKRIISNVMLVAAAATAFFSCQKQEVVVPETEQEVMLTFSSEKPAFDDETKTEWTGNSIVWSAGDKISVAYTVEGNWQGINGDADGNAKLYKSSELAAAAEIAKFNVSTDFKGTTEGAHVFYGVYPAPQSTDFANAPVASLTIPANQTPNANTFDASGDLMVGVSKEYESRPESGETISLKWNRLVAHAVITLKEINGFIAGETLTGITLTAQEGANLVGKQNVDLTTGAVENNDGASNIIKIAPGSLSVDANGTVTFWVCVLPETLTSLTVEVDTDQATYTRKITGISKTFKQNARNTLAVNMSSATRVTKETESWVLVTPADGITEGTYALVASTSTKTGVLVSTNGSSSAPAFNTGITIEDNVLKGVAESMQFDIAAVDGGYTLAVAGQTTNYLYTTATNNGVRVGTNANKIWTIGTHADNSSAFVFKCNATSRFLGVYNNSDWRCYTAYNATNYKAAEGSSEIYLYKKTTGAVVPDTTPAIVVSGEISKSVEFGGGEVTFNYTLKNLDGEELTWEVSNEDMISSVSAEDGVLTVTVAENDADARTATITLTCGDAESVVLTINQAKYVDTSIIEEISVKDFLAKSVDANVWFKLTGKVVSLTNTTYGNFNLVDETGTVYVYGLTATKVAENDKSFSSIGVKEGDVVTLIGTRAEYNSSAQVGGPAYYVSHQQVSADPVIICQNNIVTITAAGSIYYTINGTTPSNESTKYTEPFEIDKDTTVKAIAIEDGKLSSDVVTYDCKWQDPNAGEDDDVKVPSSTACYTLSTASVQGTNNSYAGNCDIIVNNIKWNVNGNTQINPWRIGGKNLTKVNRTVYSKTAYSSALSKVEFVAGSTTATWNSLTLEYSTNSSFSDAQSIVVTSVAANETISFAPEGGFPENCYFRFTLNVTAGSSNQYVQLKEIKFYGYEN